MVKRIGERKRPRIACFRCGANVAQRTNGDPRLHACPTRNVAGHALRRTPFATVLS